MSRLFTPELAAFYEGFYAEKGIKIVKGDVVSSLEGADGKVGRGSRFWLMQAQQYSSLGWPSPPLLLPKASLPACLLIGRAAGHRGGAEKRQPAGVLSGAGGRGRAAQHRPLCRPAGPCAGTARLPACLPARPPACLLCAGQRMQEAPSLVHSVSISEIHGCASHAVQGPPGGIKVNSQLQSSNADVYAAGDVATFPLKLTGDMARQEHVTCARLTAAHAMAEAMTPGSAGDFDYLPFFYSRVFILSWQFYGLNEGECVVHGDISAANFGAYWVKDGAVVVGAFLESGSAEENAAIKKVVAARASAPADLKQQGIAFALGA